MSLPVLYSFRRCPFAIRARMTLSYAGIKVELREVSLKNKPKAMLDVSSKGTVPVLVDDDKVIDESLDIMLWALGINDPDGWYSSYSEAEKHQALQLITHNDEAFKAWLDKYKYADRHPEFSREHYRDQCSDFLLTLETLLQQNRCLLTEGLSLADIALFPFIRQFAMVDRPWFDQSPYSQLRHWLNHLLELPLFIRVMAKTQTPQS